MLAAVEAVCDDRFCLLVVSGTPDAVAPLVIVNGPIRSALDLLTPIARSVEVVAHHKAVGSAIPRSSSRPST